MTTKTVYAYHPETKEFTGVDVAEPCAIEENVWLKPGFSTYYPVPHVGANEIAVFRQDPAKAWDDGEGIWEVKADFRGKTLFSKLTGQIAKIDEIGVTPESLDLTDKPMPTPMYSFVDGDWVPDETKRLDMVRRSKTLELRRVNKFFSTSIDRMYGGTQQLEKDTWQTKLTLARQILAGEEWHVSFDLFLDSAEIDTSEERHQWASKVVEKNALWLRVIGIAEKHRTRGRKIIDETDDLVQLKSALIEWQTNAENEVSDFMALPG